MTLIILFITGLVIGSMNAVAGGGSLIGFPVLIAMGLNPLAANATGFLAMVPGQAASALGYVKLIRETPKKYGLLLIPCMIGAGLGSYILRITPVSEFNKFVPLLIAVSVFIFAVQPYIRIQLKKHMDGRVKHQDSLIILSAVLFFLSIYGGYFGPGFGFMLLAFISFTSLHHAHQMNAMKNITATLMGLTSTLVLASGPYIHWDYGIVMAIGSTIGGYYGAKLALRTSSRTLRILVVVIGVATTIWLALRDYT